MDAVLDLLREYQTYLLVGIAAVAVLIVLLMVLNRPTREEKAHDKRLGDLKEKGKGRYRDLRPLK